MKTTYIYLVTYPKGYLYVGSHTWDGPVGELDLNYHGSSSVAKNYNWMPIKEEILEYNVSLKLRRERFWIEKYCSLYGIADCALIFAKYTKWTSKFRNHGLMLNLHANDAVPALQASLLKESRYKQVNTKKKNKTGIFSSVSHSSTNKTRMNNGEDLTKGLHTSEVAKKAALSRAKNGTTVDPNKWLTREDRIKGMETRRRNARRYRVVKDDKVLCEGTMTEIKKKFCPHRLNYKMFEDVGSCINFRYYSIIRIS